MPARIEVKAISCPVGLQAGAVFDARVLVRRRAPVPSTFATQISVLPERFEANAMRLPSGLMVAPPRIWLPPFSPVTLGVLRFSKMWARNTAGEPCR